ncbi:L,D-transpeptidase family protein [Ferrimonas marina]|uniref:L,D-transpeptidase family protein n=1 Tax=Ferrimonas marina TaxID=299255 RepID=UPI00082A426C|nr:L,D-transpeptidase family protein [Ferrimonas marina]
MSQKHTVTSVLSHYGPAVQQRLAPFWQLVPEGFEVSNAKFVALKAEQKLEIWLQSSDGQWHFFRTYPILKTSGSLRPKMRQGDLQVPEGVYRLDAANPNSQFHLSLRINYPNEMDRYFGAQEQRGDLGGNIFIHGNEVSWGCLAMGDRAIEELFVLAHDLGLDNIEVVIAPRDPRQHQLKRPDSLPKWVDLKYLEIQASIAELDQHSPALLL